MKEQHLSKDSSIYHYRLLQRIHYHPLYIYAYWGLLALVIIWDLIRWNPLPIVISLVSIPLLQTLLIYLYFTLKEKRPLRQWSVQFQLPWVGYVPTSYFSLERMLRLHLHLTWVAIVICGCFYPWISLDMIFHLIGVHLWLLLPRYVLMYKLRHYRDIGYLKLNEHDTSCYAQ
ncbi:hypothetical protein [Paenibacillus rigui]|uniref:Uncharacterized protein n=1 Tax=Paenibacillus rigui TaxID=554312 RepID=A0A229UGZ9_9BACL|nr:hypothetical protein [Paenibacillus rigui]OXM82630.1 hypothetical protein CF651_30180 [Paenibacillus rigui]